MADLTTKAVVKTYMNLTGADFDDRIDQLIPAVSRAIEKYCNRTFNLTTYKEFIWSEGGSILYLPQYPVVEMRRVVEDTEEAVTIKNTSSDASGATVQVAADKIYLNVFGGANASNSNQALASQTLTQIKTWAEGLNKGWEVTIDSGYESHQATELMPFASQDALSPEYAEAEILEEPMTDLRLIPDSGRLERLSGRFPTGNLFIEFTAGYSTIPADLESIATRMTADAVRESGADKSVKSEKWPDYGYTRFDSKDIDELIERYESELSFWRRISL